MINLLKAFFEKRRILMKKISSIIITIFAVYIITSNIYAFPQSLQRELAIEKFKSRRLEFISENRILQKDRERITQQINKLAQGYDKPADLVLKEISDLKNELFVIVNKELQASYKYIQYLESTVVELINK